MGYLYIETACADKKTVVKDSRFTAPFKITKPFTDGETVEIMIMQASAGILEGDSHELEFKIGAGSHAVITGQSYTKLFSMEHGRAGQHLKITVEKDASLFYFPCPVIPFRDSEFINVNEVYLEQGARFAMVDILSCGRKAMGEVFEFRKYHSRTTVFEDGHPVFADNTRLVPGEHNPGGIGYFETYTHQGMAYIYGADETDEIPPEEGSLTAAASCAKKGKVIRVLGNSSDEIENYLKKIIYGGK